MFNIFKRILYNLKNQIIRKLFNAYEYELYKLQKRKM